MKIPYSIIKNFIPELTQSPEELSDLITLKSYEVDSVYNPADALKNIVVGHIQKITPHPNADKLNITEVLVDNNEVLTIVCGAKNIELGQKVAVAKIGAILPNGLHIQMVNLRGQDSFGMICSAQELGFDSKSEGILVLSANANVGESVAKALNLDEAIIDIDNKGLGTRASDSSSFYGIAREIALITDNKLREIELGDIPVKKKLKKNIHIKTNLCKYYSILEVSGLSNYKFDSNILSKGGYRVDLYVQTDVFKLDSEIHRTLDIINQKANYPAVDLGNYVLFEIGQPLHIFDAEKVKGKDIIIREAKAGEIFEDLNGVSIILEEGDIVICDSENIIALAGIMGGKSTAVGDGTTQVLIESANFDSNRIRQTARRLKLLTESAKRFERQVPVELADMSIRRIIHIVEKANLQVLGYINKGHNVSEHKAITLDYNYVRKYIGANISDTDIDKILKSLQIEMHRPLGSHKHNLIPPYWRLDLNTPEEYIEEIARLYGYDKIEPNLDIDKIKPNSDKLFNFKRIISEELAKMKYIEILTYPYSKEGLLQLLNPVDESKPYLRQSLAQSMTEAISKNKNFSQTVKFFEISNVFTSDQHLHLSISSWDKSKDNNTNINQTYNDLLQLIYQLGFDYTKFKTEVLDSQTIIKYADNVVGIINELIVIELDLDTLSEILIPIKENYNHIPKYPAVKRDITITVDKQKLANEIYNIIQSLVSVRCQYIGLKDKFEQNDLINYTFHLEFRDLEKSLSDEEVNAEIDIIQNHFQTGK